MRSYCIKINNENIINYLLNKIEKINFENIYYCDREFKIYKNVCIHYVGTNIDGFINFVANLISDMIIDLYEEKIINRIISSNYFYFDEYEQKIILENCREYCKVEYVEKKETLYCEIEKYINENKAIVLEGIINFRIKEYNEFINLLKVYINTTKPGVSLLHLIYINGESILIDENKNVVSLSENIFNAKYLSDISFSSNDFALNTLLSLLPEKLEVHVIDVEDEFINTLKLIFEDRIYICKDCNICKTYKMINGVKILN